MKLITLHKSLISLAVGLGALFCLRSLFAVMEGTGSLFVTLVTFTGTGLLANYLVGLWPKQDLGSPQPQKPDGDGTQEEPDGHST